MKNTAEWAAIGRVVGPFGVRGELKVMSLSDIPNRFVKLKYVYIAPDYTRYAITGVRPYKGDMLLLSLKGVEDANTAETLRNHELLIPASELAKLPPDSYYQHDILGLTVLLMDKRKLGTISDIWTTGGNDIYVVKGDGGQQHLIPAIKEVVRQIDLVRHVMYIEPLKGLLDDDAVFDEQEEPEDQTDGLDEDKL